jgi:hypothetical protein
MVFCAAVFWSDVVSGAGAASATGSAVVASFGSLKVPPSILRLCRLGRRREAKGATG